MKNKFLKLLFVFPFLFTACTDLDETYYNEIDSEKIPASQKIAAVYNTLKGSASSNPMTCPFWKLVYAVQTTTDEICVPRQNANDWQDGGIYQDMQQHTWKADNTILLSSWNYLYNIVSNCNLLLVKYDQDLTNEGRAELQTLRAYAYYRLMDLFGNVPLLTEENFGQPQLPAKTPRAQLFAWIEGQLTYIEGTELSVENYLPTRKYGAMTKGVLNTLKARLYLNSKVFLDLDDNDPLYVGSEGYLDKAIDACDAVINSGTYTLESNVFANWYLDNGSHSKEIILAIPYLGDGSLEGNQLHIETLIPPMQQALGDIIGEDEAGKNIIGGGMYANGVSGWHVNPGITKEDPNALINLFDENDNRRLSILTGQLYDRAEYVKNGVFKKLTFGNWSLLDPLIPESKPGDGGDGVFLGPSLHANFTPWFYGRGFDPNGENKAHLNVPKAFGARIIKFELAENPQFYESPIDMVVMRYAEVLYTKAEALIRQNKNAEAIPLFQEVLQYRGFDPMSDANYTKNYPFRDMDTDIEGNDTEEKISAVALMSKRWLTGRTTDLSSIIPATPDLEFMDKEWRREFAFEDRRRTDMIRMGKFVTGTWGAHETPTNDPNRNLFPIPQLVLNANPALIQNQGY